MNEEVKGHTGGGYDQSVLKLSWIFAFFVGFILLIGISFVLNTGMFSLFARYMAEKKPAFEQIAQPRRLPVGPRLQVDPAKELRELHEAEDKLLENYAWVDREAGIVRVPIERAMALLVQRGLPVRSSSPQPPGEKP